MSSLGKGVGLWERFQVKVGKGDKLPLVKTRSESSENRSFTGISGTSADSGYASQDGPSEGDSIPLSKGKGVDEPLSRDDESVQQDKPTTETLPTQAASGSRPGSQNILPQQAGSASDPKERRRTTGPSTSADETARASEPRRPIDIIMLRAIREIVRAFKRDFGGQLARYLTSCRRTPAKDPATHAVAIFPGSVAWSESLKNTIDATITIQCHPWAKAHVQSFLKEHQKAINLSIGFLRAQQSQPLRVLQIETGDGTFKECTLGGLVSLTRFWSGSEDLFGLTTGHGLENLSAQSRPDASDDPVEKVPIFGHIDPYQLCGYLYHTSADVLRRDTSIRFDGGNLDWAVLELNGSQPLFSSFEEEPRQAIHVSNFAEEDIDDYRQVVLLNDRLGYPVARLSPSTAFVCVPPSLEFIEVTPFSFNHEETITPYGPRGLSCGDSGSWAISVEREGALLVYGQLIGTNCYGEALLMPMDKIISSLDNVEREPGFRGLRSTNLHLPMKALTLERMSPSRREVAIQGLSMRDQCLVWEITKLRWEAARAEWISETDSWAASIDYPHTPQWPYYDTEQAMLASESTEWKHEMQRWKASPFSTKLISSEWFLKWQSRLEFWEGDKFHRRRLHDNQTADLFIQKPSLAPRTLAQRAMSSTRTVGSTVGPTVGSMASSNSSRATGSYQSFWSHGASVASLASSAGLSVDAFHHVKVALPKPEDNSPEPSTSHDPDQSSPGVSLNEQGSVNIQPTSSKSSTVKDHDPIVSWKPTSHIPQRPEHGGPPNIPATVAEDEESDHETRDDGAQNEQDHELDERVSGVVRPDEDNKDLPFDIDGL
ncbi:hypothetical protein B0H66DRAFT_607277 [Apodospora peruviana]|uniref:Uncharacterized protein n=1 Tax=Apodospora peruviana TaxID=516989 RepID=A0AAE0HWT1_9PEZI|nr:hypothetical protein B0H66DRAFT_607277 [Apodospora peruviana]